LKTGWWEVSFKLTLAGEEVDFIDLSEITQEHIVKCIAEGYKRGEIIEDDETSCEDSVEDCDETVYEWCTGTRA
jgi:hypothetical protein